MPSIHGQTGAGSRTGATGTGRAWRPAPKRRAASGLEVRSRFLAVAEPMFLRYGYERTTVEQICRETRASKRTFYQYFRDRADLASGLLFFQGLELLATLRQQAGDADPRIKLAAFLDGYQRLLRERPCFAELQRNPQFLYEMRLADRPWPLQLLHTALAGILRDGLHRATLRPLDVEATVPLLLRTLYATVCDHAASDPGLPLERRQAQARRLLLDGLLA
jgi:AcrR family transcriptional regulator